MQTDTARSPAAAGAKASVIWHCCPCPSGPDEGQLSDMRTIRSGQVRPNARQPLPVSTTAVFWRRRGRPPWFETVTSALR